MRLISTLLNFFGCPGQTKRKGGELSEELKEYIAKSVEDFKNRPIHKTLTERIIDITSDDNLLQVVFDNISEKLPNDYEKEYETVMTWSKSKQAIYMVWWLEAEVNNGGYNQFYANSSGQFYKHLPEALRLIGATKFSDLTQRANNTYEKRTQYQDGTIEGFSKSYDDNPLNKFDTEFYDLYNVENLQQIQVDYIKRHKSEFIGKQN